MNVLLRLKNGFGLGDVVSFTSVLRHLARFRPTWQVDVQAPRGAHTALHGLCRASFWDDSAAADDYVTDLPLTWYDPHVAWPHKPSTKVTYFLGTTFDVPYTPQLGSYEIRTGRDTLQKARKYTKERFGSEPIAFLHYEGGKNDPAKYLTDVEGVAIFDLALRLGFRPVVLDWHSPPSADVLGRDAAFWGHNEAGLSDAELLCAVLRQGHVYVGVDSGPAKVAAAAGVPCLICWTGHHPVQHFDPTTMTTHLVPQDVRSLLPEGRHGDGAQKYFESVYRHVTYADRKALVARVEEWMTAKSPRTTAPSTPTTA